MTEKFKKVIKDFVKDIILCFPELYENLDLDLKYVLETDEVEDEKIINLQKYCKELYPNKFFDILYQNNELFEKEPIYLLPNIDFQYIWKAEISEKTRETIWKYLQLILFSLVGDLDSKSFGESAKLFEAINEDELKSKLEETINQMNDIFGGEDKEEGSEDKDKEKTAKEGLPDPEELHSHLNSLLDGKLGRLAKEIAEETAKDLDIDINNDSDMGDIFQKLFKNPGKLMGLVKNVGGKLDQKIKSGDIKESELMEEANELMKKMKNVPGMPDMKDIQSMLGKMGGKGKGKAKFNTNAFQTHLDQAKERERMLSKLEERKKQRNQPSNTETENLPSKEEIEKIMAELLESEDLNKVVSKKPKKKKKKN